MSVKSVLPLSVRTSSNDFIYVVVPPPVLNQLKVLESLFDEWTGRVH